MTSKHDHVIVVDQSAADLWQKMVMDSDPRGAAIGLIVALGIEFKRALDRGFAQGRRYERRRRKRSCEARHAARKGRCACGAQCPFLAGRTQS